jgi:hypothetical protein
MPRTLATVTAVNTAPALHKRAALSQLTPLETELMESITELKK